MSLKKIKRKGSSDGDSLEHSNMFHLKTELFNNIGKKKRDQLGLSACLGRFPPTTLNLVSSVLD